MEVVDWLSPHEVIASSRESLLLLDLVRGTKRLIPFTQNDHPKKLSRYIPPDTVSASPDGKWLTFMEQIEKEKAPPQTTLFLMRPDGTRLRRIPLASHISCKPLWLPDSRGWISYWSSFNGDDVGRTFYHVEASIPPRDEPLRTLRSPKIELKAIQTVLVSLRVDAPAIPERETWEELLYRKLPVGYEEIWVLSAQGKRPYCLVREPLTAGARSSFFYDSAFFIMSLSPDGKQALVQGRQGDDYYLLPLSRP